MRFKFIEKRSIDKGSGFVIPNEELSILREFVSHANPSRAAAICSGGEVPLTVLLPICQEVVAVDHSKTSLGWACLKALLMEHFDGNAIKKMFLLENQKTLMGCFKELQPEMPKELVKSGPFKYESIDYYPHLVTMWLNLPTTLIDQARERLDGLTLIHGDIRDLEGEYDLLYASNATEHQGHDGRGPTANDFLPVIRKDGHLLHTHEFPSRHSYPPLSLRHHKRFSGHYNVGGMNWNYYLHAKV